MAHTNVHTHTTIHRAHVTLKYACIFTHTTPHTHTTVCMQDGNCPLFYASQEGHDKTVEVLLQAGATVDLQDKVKVIIYQYGKMVCIQT